MTEVQAILKMVEQDSIVEIIALFAVIGLLVMIVLADYEPKWQNKKKPRVFRERF